LINPVLDGDGCNVGSFFVDPEAPAFAALVVWLFGVAAFSAVLAPLVAGVFGVFAAVGDLTDLTAVLAVATGVTFLAVGVLAELAVELATVLPFPVTAGLSAGFFGLASAFFSIVDELAAAGLKVDWVALGDSGMDCPQRLVLVVVLSVASPNRFVLSFNVGGIEPENPPAKLLLPAKLLAPALTLESRLASRC
jgi:hypothetical protein